jgi:hypothetical protein
MAEKQEGPVKKWTPIDVDKIIAEKKAEQKKQPGDQDQPLEDTVSEVEPWREFKDMTWGEWIGIKKENEESKDKQRYQQEFEEAKSSRKQKGYFDANRPTVIGTEKYPERSETQEHLESSTHKIAIIRMVNEGELKHCQDCWGVRKEPLDVRRMAVADGVGSAMISATASEIFCQTAVDGLDIDISKLPKINKQELVDEVNQMERSDLLKEVLLEKIEVGNIAATTLSAVEVQGDKLRYHQLGDSQIMVIRPDGKGEGEIMFETDEGKYNRGNTPFQYSWSSKDNQWRQYGQEQRGAVDVQKGDIVVMFTDGIYTGNRDQTREELHDQIRKQAGRTSLFATSKSLLAQILRDELADSANVGKVTDDVTLGVMVV